MGKRGREDAASVKTREEIDAYNASTLVRIEAMSHLVPCPPNKGLTTPCRIWDGGKNTGGYGKFMYNGKIIGVHKAALMISKGVNMLPKINEDGEKLQVAHRCDVASCCEPTHLYHATISQNGEDRSKNGLTRGENCPVSKIDDKIARMVKSSRGDGTAKMRATRFGVSLAIVNSIDNGTAWSHLPDGSGNSSATKRAEANKRAKIRRAASKGVPWTKEMCAKAEAKFNDPRYAKDHEIHSFDGTPCRMWIRAFDRDHYPRMGLGGRTVHAHIVACYIGNNYVRPENMEASHQCGQSLCVNPAHLVFKSHADNIADKIIHKTRTCKLSRKQVSEIRERCARGETQSSVAVLYRVSRSYVSDLVNNKARIND